MRGAERVVFAFGALGESGETAALTQRANAIAASGQNLVRVSLVPDIPDEAVARGVENVMQCHCQLDDAEPSAEMSAGYRDRERLRRAGFNDRDIWDIASVAAFYNMTNRLASATDMRPNSVYHGQAR